VLLQRRLPVLLRQRLELLLRLLLELLPGQEHLRRLVRRPTTLLP
jgi:hypothetical protein